MRTTRSITFGFLALSTLLVSCGKTGSNATPQSADTDKVVNVYFWAEYLAPDTIAAFEKQTGIKVHLSYIDTLETLETKMLTGHSGYDVVIPTTAFFERQIKAGAYQPLDRKQLPNWSHLDAQVMDRVTAADPGNIHGAAITWGRFGIAYDLKKVAKLLPDAPLTSWNLVFDPAIAAKLAPCGITFIDDPEGIVRLELKYLGRNPEAPSQQDLDDVEKALLRIRPYIRNIDTAGYTDAMANGDICLAIAYNSDVVLARKRALEATNGVTWGFMTPREGSILYVDLLSIPSDAPHVANAHRFINYLMDPQVIARISNTTGIANANVDSRPLLDPATAADQTTYPTPDTLRLLYLPKESPAELSRAITRLWQKFKSGQ